MSASNPLRADTLLGTGQLVGFGVATPAVPASGVPVSNPNPFSAAVYILTVGATTSWTLTDSKGNVQTVSAAVAVGLLCIVPPKGSISFVYTAAPTWKWQGISTE